MAILPSDGAARRGKKKSLRISLAGDLQDGMLAHYLDQARQSDANVEAQIMHEPFDYRDYLSKDLDPNSPRAIAFRTGRTRRRKAPPRPEHVSRAR